MKKVLLILLLPFTAWGQINLVPNPSFEDTVQCPDSLMIVDPGGNMQYVEKWHGANTLTPDYFHECSSLFRYSTPSNTQGVQSPRSGQAYAGVYSFNYNPTQGASSEAREYIYVKLDVENALEEDALYKVGFYFSASDFYSRITPDIGIQFSATFPDTTLMVLPDIPSYTVMDTNCIDSVNIDDWILVEGIYQAKGDERYLTIGCFRNTSDVFSSTISNSTSIGNETYLLIDDVFVIPLQEPATYNCLAGACVDPQDGSGLYDSLATCQAICNATAIEENNTTKQLLKITNVLGMESKPTPNVPLFYRYDDGTVEKRIVVE
jgi:hypothetical protein